MAAWSAGNCPSCGEFMPANLIHCQVCRALLNSDLKRDSVEVPKFVPLREITTMNKVEPSGYYVDCPKCNRELRVARKYVGRQVQCKFCNKQFPLESNGRSSTVRAFYSICPHCDGEIRAAAKYLGAEVTCNLCGGQLQLATSPG